jgi:hypothetical protein
MHEVVKMVYHDKEKEGNWWWQTKGTSVLRLLLPILPPKWKMTGNNVSGNSVRLTRCQLKRFVPLLTDL